MDLIKNSKEQGFDYDITELLIDFYLWKCKLQKWFRDVHNINIKVDDFLLKDNKVTWDYEISFIGKNIDKNNDYIPEISFSANRNFETYEDALEAGLIESLKLIMKVSDNSVIKIGV